VSVLSAGDAEDKSPACGARWATPNRSHDAGDPCGRPATERIGDISLCLHHFRRALDWFYKVHVAEAPDRHEAARAEAAGRDRQIAAARSGTRSIVYYLRRESDGLIKIGYTASYCARLTRLRAEHGRLRLLLATPGGRKEENEAHGVFAAHRVRGEWFRPGKPLLLYIQRARAAQDGKDTRIPEQVPFAEVRAMVLAMQADERARRASLVKGRCGQPQRVSWDDGCHARACRYRSASSSVAASSPAIRR
jgi:hypothetical protein